MKIAIALHQYFPEYFAGTETLAMRTAQELRLRGHEVIIYTGFHLKRELMLDPENSIDEYIHNEIRVKRLITVPHSQRDIQYIDFDHENEFFGRWFEAELEREKVSLVHFFHMFRLGTEAVAACSVKNIPTVLTLTDFWTVCPLGQLVLPDNSICQGPNTPPANCLKHILQAIHAHTFESKYGALPDSDFEAALSNGAIKTSPGYAALEKPLRSSMQELANKLDGRLSTMKKTLGSAKKVIVASKVVARLLDEHGLTADNQCVLPFGLDLTQLTFSRDRGTHKSLRVGFMGSIIPTKGVHVLLEAMKQLKTTPDVKLTIYGKTSENPVYFEQLQMLAANDDRINFAGTFPPEDIWKVFSEFDCLVIPSTWYENTPLVLLSAQAAKCPVICTDLDGMSEVITHEHNGLLFPSGDHGSLAECILKLHKDRTFMAALSENAKPQLSMVEYVTELEKVYDESVGKPLADLAHR